MHSHSGQFCPGHAKDQLEEVIQAAIAHGMQTFALTEHMPRNSNDDLYPEEVTLSPVSTSITKISKIEAGDTIEPLFVRHEAFLIEAARLRQKYSDKINILIGFEGDWIRPSYANLIQGLASDPNVDFFIGSVHHVHQIPIDYDATFYKTARDAAGGTDERLFEDYFDSQYEMLKALKPKVIGHFDLIRLLSDEPDRDLKEMKGVWEKAVRNLKLVVKQGGLMEINSAGLRKGLKEPYPGRALCREFLKMGGKLTLSDDSHGTAHVGTNYLRAIEYLETLGVKELFTLDANRHIAAQRNLSIRSVSLSSVKESFRA